MQDVILQIHLNKDILKMKWTKVYSQNFYYWKVQETISSFYLYFTWLCVSWKLQRHFEDMSCQNSLWQNSPEITHFLASKKMFLTNYKWIDLGVGICAICFDDILEKDKCIMLAKKFCVYRCLRNRSKKTVGIP